MKGRIIAVDGSLVVAEMQDRVVQNSVGYCLRGDGTRLLSEVIRVRGQRADLQVFEETRGLHIGDAVEFREEMLSVALGPGLLGQIYDGLQNPLPELAGRSATSSSPACTSRPADEQAKWDFTPAAKAGRQLAAGDDARHRAGGNLRRIRSWSPSAGGAVDGSAASPAAGTYTIEDEIAVLAGDSGRRSVCTMQQTWPVKLPLNVARRR